MYKIGSMPHSIPIGYTGETNFRVIEIDMTAWMEKMPAGVPSIVHIRPGETKAQAYIAATTFDSESNILTWEITAGDIGTKEGNGLMQVWLEESENDTVSKRGKSVKVTTEVMDSVNEPDDDPPEAQAAYLEQMTELKVATVEAAEDAEDAKEDAVDAAEQAQQAATDAENVNLHPAYIDSITKHWMVYDATEHQYTDTEILAEGQDGQDGQDATPDLVTKDYSDLTFPVTKDTLCYHSGLLYYAKQDISTSEEWTAAHWQKTTLEELLSLQKNDIDGIDETVYGGEQPTPETMSIQLEDGHFINVDTNDPSNYGKRYQASGWQYTDYINIEKYVSIKITTVKMQNPTTAGIMFYSDNIPSNIPANCVQGYAFNSGAEAETVEERTFEKPEGAKYFRSSFRASFDNFSCVGYYMSPQGGLVQDLIDVSGTIYGTEQQVSEPVEATLTNGYLINANKNDASYYGKRYSVSNTWQITGFVNIEKYESIKITAIRFNSPTDAGIVFYSDNNANNIPQNCIDGFTFNSGATTKYVEERTFEKPAGAKYIRTTFQTSFDNFAITGYYKQMQGGLVQDVEELIVQSGANTKTIKEIEYNRFDYAVKAIDFDDGVKTDDQIIADALALLSNFDKKTLIFDTRDWLISEAILLEQNTTVYIDGVKIKQADETFDNVFRGKNFVVDTENPNKFALSVSDTQNISIIGLNGATIEGPTTNATIYNPYLQRDDEMVGDAYGWRAFQIYFCNCNGLEISGLRIIKTRNWAMSFEFCQNAHIHDIYYDTGYVPNADGIDLRIGCHHFNIHDITGYTKDDTVACSALYPGYNNSSYPSQTSKTMYPCVASKTGESIENTDKRTLDIHDVIISNIYTSGSEQCVRCLCNNGIRTYNVGISNVIEDEDGTYHFTSIIEMSHDYGSSWSQDSYQDGDLNNISASNIEANGATRVLNCKGKVQNVYMNKLVQSDAQKAIYYIQYMDGITITNTESNP